MADSRRTRDYQPDSPLELQYLNDPSYTPLDRIGGPGMGGAGNDGLPQSPAASGIENRVDAIQQESDLQRGLLGQLASLRSSQQPSQGLDLGGMWQGVKDAGSRGLSALGSMMPDQGTVDNIAMRLQNAHAIGTGGTPLYMQQQQHQMALGQHQELMAMKRQQMAYQLEQQNEQKRQHDLGLFERALSHPRASTVLEQLAQDPQFAFAKQAGMVSKSFKEGDYGSMQAYMEFIPEDVQKRFMEGNLPHHELTSWIDMAREDAKVNAKANAKQMVLKRAMGKPEDQRTPFEQSLVEERMAAMETQKLKDEETKAKTVKDYAQASKFQKEAEQGLTKTSPVIDSIAHAFHGVGFNELPEGGQERRDVINRYSQLYAQGRNAVDLGSPAPVDKRSNVVSRKDFLEKGSMNRPPAGVSKGQLATGDYIEMSDAQQKQAKDIEMAKGNLTSMFDLIEPHIKAKGPLEAAGQYAKLQAGAMSGVNPDAATYKAGSEAFSSVFSRVFGGEVGVMTDRDINRWQATLPTFGDTEPTMKKKKELFFKIYDEAVTQFRRSIAGDGVDKKNMQGLLSQVDSLQKDQPKGKSESSSQGQAGPYSDPAKEKRYQEWLKKQGK